MSPFERDPYAFEIIGDSPDLGAFEPNDETLRQTDDDEAARRRRLIGVAVVALLVLIAGAAGFLAGSQRHRPATGVSASSANLASAGAGPVELSDPLVIVDHCTAAAGSRLQLGVKFRNDGNQALTLQWIALGEALPGRQGIGAWRGTCGQTQNVKLPNNERLEPGATLWVSSTIDARVPCDWLQLLPLSVSYWADGQAVSAQTNPFTDLAGGSYPRCTS